MPTPLTPIPVSLADLHGRTDMDGLLPLLPLVMEFPAGLTAAVLIQAAQDRHVYPDLDEQQLAWKVRRSISIFEKVGYLKKALHGWHIPDVVRIKTECEEAARQINRLIAEMNSQRNNLLQAALLGPSDAPAPKAPRKPGVKASKGMKESAGRGKSKG